jgi:hypothetical protein
VPNERTERRSGDDEATEPERAPAPACEPAAPVGPGAVLAGRFVVDRIVGRGGMGIVVRAQDRALGAAVAIKILRAEYAGERVWRERLAREVRLARQIQHPNVCRMFDFGQADGHVFLVMEMAARGSLREEIASRETGGRPLPERIADACAMAAGLAAIHEAGIVHRDVSPQNVLRMADGRLVLSDFGLAIEPSETTTTVRGGTVAYMAPEIVRGGRVGAASDVWALGVSLHEAVFGDRPRWREGRGGEMLAPALARKLAPEERVVLEVCRACTAPDPARRPTAVAVRARLTDGALGRPNWGRRGRWAGAVLGAVLAIVASVAAIERLRGGTPGGVADGELAVVMEGQPEDWSDKARVLGEIEDQIRCVVPLPDGHSVRIVWGYPPRADDVDTRTGRRGPSPLVPAAYAEGCPDLSPDGERLLFQGHVPDGRAFAFLSNHPDGRDAVPVVAVAPPSYDSEPRWLSDGDTFSFDVDLEHAAIFAVESRRTTVINAPILSTRSSLFRWTTGDRLLIGIPRGVGYTALTGFDAATLAERDRFVVPGMALDLVALAGGRFIYTAQVESWGVFEVDPVQRRGRRLAAIKGQAMRFLTPVAGGLFLTSRREWSTVRAAPGTTWPWSELTIHGFVDSVSACGGDLLTAEEDADRHGRIARRRSDGTLIRYVSAGPDDWGVSCTRDGHWYYSKFDPDGSRVRLCRESEGDCRLIPSGPAPKVAVSPDGRLVAIIHLENRGMRISVSQLPELRQPRMLRQTDSGCRPVWSSDTTLWISHRQGGAFAWNEVDVDSGRDTGRARPGTTDCSDGVPDPSSPDDVDGLRVVHGRASQLRVIASKYLPR